MASTVVIYVGGGCDGYCTSTTRIVQNYAREHGGRFFMHFEHVAIQRAMITARQGGSAIVLIGHSWGGAAVINLMLDRRTPRPDLIVTVDPVGKVTTFGVGRSNRFGGLWVNITADDDAPSKTTGNRVAKLWGKTRSTFTSHADVQVDSRRVHEAFGAMLRDARVPQMIAAIRIHAKVRA